MPRANLYSSLWPFEMDTVHIRVEIEDNCFYLRVGRRRMTLADTIRDAVDSDYISFDGFQISTGEPWLRLQHAGRAMRTLDPKVHLRYKRPFQRQGCLWRYIRDGDWVDAKHIRGPTLYIAQLNWPHPGRMAVSLNMLPPIFCDLAESSMAVFHDLFGHKAIVHIPNYPHVYHVGDALDCLQEITVNGVRVQVRPWPQQA